MILHHHEYYCLTNIKAGAGALIFRPTANLQPLCTCICLRELDSRSSLTNSSVLIEY